MNTPSTLLLIGACTLFTLSACSNDAAQRKQASDAQALEQAVPVVEEPKVEEPKVEEPVVAEPVVEEPKVEAPKAALVHEDFDALLKLHVDAQTGGVDYDGFKADEAKLDVYLKRVAEVDLSKLSEQEKYAAYLNAYNGYTVKLILNNYPGVKSIRKLKKPWDTAAYVVGGETLSLNDIEHKKLRPVYKDPRIHFAVNCASVGCPKLRPYAYNADALSKQLDAVTMDAMTSARHVSVKKGALYLTKLMDWYKDDFVKEGFHKSAASVPAYVAQYTDEKTKDFIKSKNGKPRVKFLDYNWNLNSKANMAKK